MPVESLLKDPGLTENDKFADYKRYAEQNLSAFPVYISGNQITPPQGHQKYANNIPSKTEIDSWVNSNRVPQAFGLAMGKTYDADHRLVCIDVDHPGLVKSIQSLFPTPCARFGSKGIGLFYRVDRNDKDMKKSVNLMIPGRNSPAVEYLSVGRFTFIPPSIHRKTGDRYKWVGVPLLTALPQLPPLTSKDLRIIQTIVGLDVDGATVDNLIAGEGTHYATLSLCGALVARGLDAERIIRAVELLFPPEYQGDTLRQIPEMVESAFRKGFDKKQIRPSDGDIDDEDLTDLFADWHYVTNVNRMVNVVTKDVFDKERFDAVMARQVRRATSVYVQWPNASIKKSMTYLPGKPAIVEDSINMWRPSELNPKSGDVQPWIQHIMHFYSEDEVNHMLDWIAHTLQRPSIKPGHAILMGSRYEGVGKDLWLLPVRAAFGKHNVSEIGADSLASQFNEWLVNKHLIIVQEIWSGSRRELSNQLKPLLSAPPDEIMVNEKGVSRYATPNICATIMLTNHKDAVSMAAEDRRYFIIWSDKAPMDPDYYYSFAEWVMDPENQSHVYDYLLKRDVSKFNVKARPPKTAAKTEMVEATMTKAENLVAVIRDFLVEENLGDVVSMPPIYDRLREKYPDNARDVSRIAPSHANYPIKLALKQLGFDPYHKKVHRKKNGIQKSKYIYIKTSVAMHYADMTDSDLFTLAEYPFGQDGKSPTQIIADANDTVDF
jgi:hypothetical protein